jgi:NAD(P)H-dependent FMN reductase
MKKILAITGSNSSTSINKALLKHTLTYFENVESKLVDMNTFEMPLYSMDREKRGVFPKEAQQFIDMIASADLLIISLAEHNSSYAAAFKNLIDWSSRLNNKLFQEKPMFLMSTSPGKKGGANVMSAAASFFPFIGADIIGNFSLPKFNENFDTEKGITDYELKSTFLGHIKSVKERLH